MCQDIARDAKSMYDDGMTIDRIQDEIFARYARSGQ